MESPKDLIMYYHSAIKTVGSYTSLSFAALAYSRVYRGKGDKRNLEDIIYNLSLIITSIIFVFISIVNNVFFIMDYEVYQNTEGTGDEQTAQLEPIPYGLLLFNLVILGLGLYTFIRQAFFTGSNTAHDMILML